MYGDLILDRLGGKFLGPALRYLELLHMLSSSSIMGASGNLNLNLNLNRMKRMNLVHLRDRSKTGSPVERMNITLVPPKGKHGCAIKLHFSESEQNVLP